MSRNPEEIVRTYFAAWPAHDRAAMEALMTDDFHFTSPLDNRLDRDTFFAHCWPNNGTTYALQIVRLVAGDDVVVVTYELTLTNGRRFRNTEAVTLRDGKVREVEVYFGWNLPHDAEPGGFVEQS